MAFVREKIKKGIPYYYIVENYREGAKVRQRILEYIGPLDALKALALSGYRAKKDGDPITNVNCENLSFEAYEYGSVMGMYWASKIIGIENICDDVFDKVTLKDMNRGKILLMAMIQRVVCPGSKREFETWVSKTSLPYHLKFDPGDFDSQTFWEAMDSITEEQIRIAWNKIINAYMSINNINPSKMHLDYIVYHEFIDAKSGRCIICKRGHDKQKRDDLIQFTLAVLTSKEFNVPFAWHIYPGNENDKQEVGFFTSYIEEQLKELGMNPPDVTVTFDGESHSADNFKDIGFHFVCACSFKNHKELYEIDIDDYENIEIVIKYHKNIGMSKGITRLAYEVKDIECFGVHGKGVLIFSQDLKNEQMAQLNRDLDYIRSKVLEFQERIKNKKSEIYDQLKRVKEEVEEEAIIAQKYNEAIDQEERERTEKGEKKRGRKKKYKEIPVWNATSAMKTILENQIYSKAKYAKMFTSITVRAEENGMFSLEWAENNEEREKYCRKYYGKEFICTDQTTWGIKEIIEGYVDQECIENGIFRGTKEADYFSALPQFHWTDQKLRVHFFLCFGALVIEEVLNKHLKDDGLIYTKSKMLDKLSEIHDGWIFENDKSVKRVTEKLDPLHQQLWESVLKLKEIANC